MTIAVVTVVAAVFFVSRITAFIETHLTEEGEFSVDIIEDTAAEVLCIQQNTDSLFGISVFRRRCIISSCNILLTEDFFQIQRFHMCVLQVHGHRQDQL